MTDQPHSLALLDKFRVLLAKAETLEEVTDLRSKADAVRVWAKSAAMGLEAQNRAAELKLRAERKAGELLANLNLRGGDRKSNGHADRLNLADLGINQSQSKRWQKEAKVPETEFERYVKLASQFGEEVTAAGLLRLSRKPTCTSPSKRKSSCLREAPADYAKHPENSARQQQQQELIQELANHHQLLCSLLQPVCDGAIENLLPIQRQALRHYLADTRHLLEQLIND